VISITQELSMLGVRMMMISWLMAAAAFAAEPVATNDKDLEKAGADGAAVQSDAGTGKPLAERIRAVSRRTFLKAGRFEFAPAVSFTTNDPFFRSWALGARISYHFSEEFALDFGGSGTLFQQPIDTFRVIADNPVTPPKGTSLVAGFDAGVTFSPIYGKVALASELVGHFDVFVSAGVAGVIDSAADNLPIHPGLALGLGGRLFLNRWLVVRADVRDYVYPSSFTTLSIANLVTIAVGVGIFFPFDFDYSAETLGAKS
jgi:outer membrane beta-barrel protein